MADLQQILPTIAHLTLKTEVHHSGPGLASFDGALRHSYVSQVREGQYFGPPSRLLALDIA